MLHLEYNACILLFTTNIVEGLHLRALILLSQFVLVDKNGTTAFIIIQRSNVMQIHFPLSWKWIMNTDNKSLKNYIQYHTKDYSPKITKTDV